MRDNFTTMNTGVGSDIQQVVSMANRIFIVFDDKHRIAKIPQMFQCFDQLVVISLVQAN